MGQGDATAYAVHADVAKKSVYRWIEKGTIQKLRDGRIDFASADATRGGSREPGATDSGHDQPLTYVQAQARNEAAKARINELKAEMMAGDLIPVADVQLFVADVIRTFRGRIDAMPDALAPELAAESNEHTVRTRIAAECNAALVELERTLRRRAGIVDGAAEVRDG